MNLHPVDIGIIVGYILLTVLIGYFISKKASQNLDSYFLGGKTIPWYVLGLSNASGMFDITGTMWMVSLAFIYGVKSVFIPWLWPVWNQIFLMIFLAVWLRRSNVMTGAEWLKTRFGNGRGAELSHIVVVIFAIIAVIGFIAYGFEGIGKFATMFLPWDLSTSVFGFAIPSAKIYAAIIMALTTIYVIKGGMYSVVMTELIQFVVMTIACIIVGIIAINMVTPEQITAVVPEGWKSLAFDWKLNLDWSTVLPAVNDKIESDGYSLFGTLMMMMIFKGILVSIAGPVPSYDMQRIMATESPKDAAKMSGIVSLALFIPRYLMIMGLAVIGLVYLSPQFAEQSGPIDFEMVLPFALQNFIPVGLKGLLLAGLISAFMSTFAANVNAGPAYIVNDIIKKYFRPNATDKQLVMMSYIASLAVVIVGMTAGLFVSSIDSILKWIVAALFGGYTAANMLKWVWWRFNGFGYFYGMMAGMGAAVVVPFAFSNLSEIMQFPIIFLISLATSIVASLFTKPDDEKTLMTFYTTVRPWGFWQPIAEKCKAINPNFKENKGFGKDMFNCAVGAIWQLSLHLIPVFLIIGEYEYMAYSIVLMIVTMIWLKIKWHDEMEDYPEDMQDTLQAIEESTPTLSPKVEAVS
ncbi:sodium:solute symporter family protein [Flammeovirga kamogawensis]|uniref:Na+:solute symporter n=1 Tax=Flammeovirga kamogawensis TaxID=373891 RepID=A0ABX8H3U6_9BACT|nr:sodium:solute symporter family protein [Flammeovirga kamogawensis]MBB6461921.1 Na+/proline symporter [Flammeovirga kamogawensis]QWG10470.1 Na+:solute symporter [Flammeovirga kamogawensis]TRX63581.1 Na+:solute symporter [Flammeovirga kamogawensis]